MKQGKRTTKEIDLSPIAKHIHDFHEGNLISLCEWFDRAIYMFHYLDEDKFTESERQNICHTLMGLKQTFMEMYYIQNGWHYVRYD